MTRRISFRTVKAGVAMAALTLGLAGCGGGDGDSTPVQRPQDTDPGFFDYGGGLCELLALALNGTCDSPQDHGPQTAACRGDAYGNPESTPACIETSSAVGVYPVAPRIAATAPTGRVVTVSWMPPTDYSDGTWMSDLAGYSVRWSMFPDANWNTAATLYLDNPGLSAVSIELPRTGTWYLTVSAVNRAGIGGPMSNIVRVEIL